MLWGQTRGGRELAGASRRSLGGPFPARRTLRAVVPGGTPGRSRSCRRRVLASPGADRAPARDRLLRLPELRRIRAAGKGIADEDDRDSPGGDGAVRVPLEDLAKRLSGLPPPERVQQRQRAFEARLYGGSARIVGRNPTALLGRLARLAMRVTRLSSRVRPDRGRGGQRKGKQRRCKLAPRSHPQFSEAKRSRVAATDAQRPGSGADRAAGRALLPVVRCQRAHLARILLFLALCSSSQSPSSSMSGGT